jgi:hypothetical protein
MHPGHGEGMDGLADLDLGAIGGGASLAVALLQLGLRARLDLGGATLATIAVTVLLVPALGPLAAALLAGAVLLAALGWWLAAARGVGRPELAGLVIAAAVLSGLALAVLPERGVDAAAVRGGGAGATALMGVIAVLLARERRGLRGQRVYHWREVPVRSADDAPAREVG